MSASADVLAMAKVEVDLASIPEGKNVSSPGVTFTSGNIQHLMRGAPYRSSSSGEASPSSSDTVQKPRLPRQTRSTSRRYVIPRTTRTV
jgi:hypothetical protein